MKTGIILFAIISMGVLVYSNSMGNDFIWDDSDFVIQNDFIKNPHLFPSYFTSNEALARGGLAGENYRPFLVLSYAIDYFFWKLNPLGYHLSNLFFHIANAILVFYLISLLVKNKFIASFTSLFFLTHPIQTESVTWISGRADVLFLFFYLAALISYISYAKQKRFILYFASLLFFLCSLASKEMASSLPLIIILWDLFYGKKERPIVRAITYLPFFLILTNFVILRFNIIGRLTQRGYWGGGLYTTFLSMAGGIVHYVRLLICPVNLCADYFRLPLSYSIKEPQVIFSIMVIILLITAALKFARRFKHASFSIFWFFVTLGPALNIIPINTVIAERFLYLPSIGYCFLVAASGALLSEKMARRPVLKRSFFYFAVFLIGIYSHLTMMRNSDWADEIALWEETIRVRPNNERAHYNLAVAYLSRESNIEKAYENARKAIELNPLYTYPRLITAFYHMQKNQPERAIKELKHALKVTPKLFEGRIHLGGIYASQGKYDLAHEEYRKTLAINPDFLQAKIAIATLHFLKDDIDLSIKELEGILKKPPPHHYRHVHAAVNLRLGDLYFKIGDKQNAIRAWTKVSGGFKDQIWFNEISGFLVEKITLEELLLKIDSWQPEFKALSYYYIGIKLEIDGDIKNARVYYRKSIDTITGQYIQVKILAARQLERLEKKVAAKYKSR